MSSKRKKIDIGRGLYSNVNSIATRNGFSPMFINGYITEADTVKMRPGLKTFANLSNTATSVSGIFWSRVLGKLLAVAEGITYEVSPDGVVTALTGETLESVQRVSFVNNASSTFMANGADVRYTDGATVSAITDQEEDIDFLDFMDEYVLGLQTGSREFWYSDPSDNTLWNAANFINVTSNEGTVQNLKVVWNEITIPGTKYTDVFYNSLEAADPFSQLQGAASSIGNSAPWSLLHTANGLYWLDDKKKFVTLVDRQPRILSIPIQRELDSLVTVSDAYAFPMDLNGRQFVVMTFYTENITYVYDPLMRVWYQWGHWNSETDSYDALRINTYTYVPDWNKHLVGDTTTGQIYEIDGNDDLDESIRFAVRTDHIDHGIIGKNKRSEVLTIKLKRGTGGEATDDTLLMRFNDNGKNNWSSWKEISLGISSDREHIVTRRCNGMYTTRQYEFVYSGSGDFEMVNPIEEDLTFTL